jgi:hypothetical protein
MPNQKPQQAPSIRTLQIKAEAKAKQIIKMIENAHRNAGKSKLKFDGPLNPANPQSVAIFRFLKDLDRFQTTSRRTKIMAKFRHATRRAA